MGGRKGGGGGRGKGGGHPASQARAAPHNGTTAQRGSTPDSSSEGLSRLWPLLSFGFGRLPWNYYNLSGVIIYAHFKCLESIRGKRPCVLCLPHVMDGSFAPPPPRRKRGGGPPRAPVPRYIASTQPPQKSSAHRGARTHDHEVKSLALCQLS